MNKEAERTFSYSPLMHYISEASI